MISINNEKQTAKIIKLGRNKSFNKTTYAPSFKIILPPKTLDIKARGSYPQNILSNFSPTKFFIDGIEIHSIEGFLQSLKINDSKKQKEICKLGGFEAKKLSKSLKQKEGDMLLFYNGKSFTQDSDTFRNLKQAVIDAGKKSESGEFEFGGKIIASIGSFLSGIKVKNPQIQEMIFKTSEKDLKYVTPNITPQYTIRDLYWNGKVIRRDSKEYQQLLDRVYNERFRSDFKFRKALKDTQGMKLTHSRGKSDISETVLTEKEFIDRLETLRIAKKPVKYIIKDYFYNIFYKIKEFAAKYFNNPTNN